MLSQIEEFVNWVHRRNAQARTWRDYRSDLSQHAHPLHQRPGAVLRLDPEAARRC